MTAVAALLHTREAVTIAIGQTSRGPVTQTNQCQLPPELRAMAACKIIAL